MSIAITGATGKIASAVISSIISHNLIPPSSLVICTSSSASLPRWDSFKALGIQIRECVYDDLNSMKIALSGCTKLFFVSSPRIDLDFGDPVPAVGKGRELHHIVAINAAKDAGVQHIYYTSLAFGYGTKDNETSKAAVMRAHLRTEAYLKELEGIKFTIIREGLYNESWPLYFGFYYKLKDETRDEVVVAGDGPLAWTSISDLGLGSALILCDSSLQYEGKTIYLSQLKIITLKDMARVVSEIQGREVRLKIVGREEYVRHYVESGRMKDQVEWWSSTYDAVKDGECGIQDGLLEELLASVGRKPKPIEETIREMMV